MSDATTNDEPEGTAEQERRRRLRAAVFGDVLPETTTDERDVSEGTGDSGEEWLRRQVPPHHG